MARQILGKVVPTGEDTYDNSRIYSELCIVMYNGQSYISKKETKGNKPDNTEYWQQLVEKPVKGTDYFTKADKDEIVNDVAEDATNKFNQTVTASTEIFNANAEQKTNDFDDNASEKADTFNANVDNSIKNFNDNANEKMSSYNENATGKIHDYNNNHSTKLKAYNDNDTLKTDNYNKNTITKTTEYNTNHTNKINTYNINASNKVDTYDANAEAKLEEYNANASDKIAEYDEHSEALGKQIISTRNELERVKNDVLETGEDTDTFIHVEDSALAELQELEIEGVCQQETTIGKNLFNCQNWKKTVVSNGVIDTSNIPLSNIISSSSNAINFSVPLNGNYSGVYSSNIKLKPGKYTLSFKDEYDTSKYPIYASFNEYVDDAYRRIYNIGSLSTGNFSYTFELAEEKTLLLVIYTNSESSYSNVNVSNIQLENGSTVTGYEPYTGGQPSPNPDYPQEIKTVTNNLKVTSCGKNLFDINKVAYPKISNGLTTTTENGYLIINGTCTKTYADISSTMNFVIPAGTYTMSIDAPQNFKVVLKRLFANGSATDNEISNGLTSKTFTTNIISNRYYLFILGLTPRTLIDNVKFKFQFERKDNATPIENYIETQIQANLPKEEFIGKIDETYKDTLKVKYNQDDGQYHLMLDKRVGKKIFSVNDGWVRSDNNASVRFSAGNADYAIEGDYDKDIPKFKSNYFQPNNFFNIFSKDQPGISWWFNNTKTYWILAFGNDMPLEDFRTFLSNHTVESYYPLSASYTLDLGVVDVPLSYNEITNIVTDSDLMPNINAKYYRNFTKTVQNLQVNEKALKQELNDINTRLTALETKSVEEPSESEVQDDIQGQ